MEELEKNETSTQAEENTVSLASAQALADALAKIEVYTPTTWVDNSSPDIDAEHLNKPEQAIKRVTDALNSAVDVIKDLQSQVTKNAGDISTVNNNLSNAMKIGESIYSGASIINGNINNRYGCFQFNVSNGTGILEGVSVFQMILESSGISLLAFKNGYWKTIWSTALKSDLWPQNSGVEITAGTDMQTITTPGHYYCSNNSTTASLKNCPISDAFTLVVYRSTGGTGDNIYYVAQEYTSYLCNKRVIQTYNKNSKNWTTHEIQFKS